MGWWGGGEWVCDMDVELVGGMVGWEGTGTGREGDRKGREGKAMRGRGKVESRHFK